MKKVSLIISFLSFTISNFAQTTSGTVTYDRTEKIDPSRMKVVTIVNGSGTEDVPPPMPTTFDDEMEITFGGGFAKVADRGPRMMNINIDSRGGHTEKKEHKEEITFKAPFKSRTFYNMNNKSKISMFIVSDEAKGTEEAYFMESPFVTPEKIEYTGKTKKIAGFECKKAIIKEKDSKVVIWYTTEIPYTFSPVEKYTPKQGFVLAIEGDELSYKATKYESKPVKVEELIMPGGAKKLTKEAFEQKRKEVMEAFRPF